MQFAWNFLQLQQKEIFKVFTKLLVSVSALSLSGNLFYKIGAADGNAWSP